jgi:hypothetical protein
MYLRPAGRPWTLTDDDMLRKLIGFRDEATADRPTAFAEQEQAPKVFL